MHLKARFVFIVFVLLACILILPYCHSNKNPAYEYHSFLNEETFKKLSRTEQVAKCGTCHQQVFENEKLGPHANAFKKLSEHRAFVNSKFYECDFYMRRVNRDFENCAGCHAPQNLWQTMLYDSLNDRGKVVARLSAIEHPMPKSRSAELRATSIDCFSCHYDGEKMVSLKHIPASDDSIAAKQTVAQITANNISCFPCHADIIRSISPEFAIKKTGSVQCSSCHQEMDATGKGTHYYFWKHNPAGKIKPDLSSLLDDWQFHLAPGKISGELVWVNNTMPHKMSDGPELIFKCEILDKDSSLLASKVVRLNNKEGFDKEMYNQVEQHNLYGEYGEQVSLNGTPLKYNVPLKKPGAKIFKITLIDKAQYWFPDSLGAVTLVKTYPVQ